MYNSKLFRTVRESNLGGEARFSAHVQAGPGVHPAYYTKGTGSFPGVKRLGRGVDHPPHLVKGKGHPITGHKGPRGGVEVYLYSFSTTALEWGGWSAPRPGRFTPGKDRVPIVQKAGWAPGPVWTCAKNLSPTGIRSPDHPALSQSLYRLNYPAHGPHLVPRIKKVELYPYSSSGPSWSVTG
jgi:hypothetical protein